MEKDNKTPDTTEQGAVKFCPMFTPLIMKGDGLNVNRVRLEFIPCLKEQCAWWGGDKCGRLKN